MQNRRAIVTGSGVSVPPFSGYRAKSTQSLGHPSCPSCALSLHSWPVHLPCERFDATTLCAVCEKASFARQRQRLKAFGQQGCPQRCCRFAPCLMNTKANNNDSLSLQQTKEKPHSRGLVTIFCCRVWLLRVLLMRCLERNSRLPRRQWTTIPHQGLAG